MKMCSECGCIMQETDTKCPNCGHEEISSQSGPEENPFAFNDSVMPTTNAEQQNEFQDSPFGTHQEANPFEGLPSINKPKVKEEVDDYNPFYMQNKTPEPQSYQPVNNNINPPKKENNSSPAIVIVIAIVVIVALGFLIAPIMLKNNSNNSNQLSIPQIKLNEIEDIGSSATKPEEKPSEDPEKPIETEDPEEPSGGEVTPPVEEPQNYTNKQVGEFVLQIPKNYNIGNYADMGITLVEPTTGATITFIQGVADIKDYRKQQDTLIAEMEQDGTTVGRVYNTIMNNMDTQVMELSQEDVSYIMMIVAVKKGKTLLIMAADQASPHEFNYDIASAAINIASTIERAGV